jgi:DGQHR domain-containing protein
MATYYRTKDEYVALVEEAREQYGDKAVLDIIRIEQQMHGDYEMFSMPVSMALVHLLFQRLPRDYNNPEGIQRAYKAQKITEIKEEAEGNPNYTAPGAVVATIHQKGRNWVKIVWDAKRERIGHVEIDLKHIAKELEKLEPNEDGALEEEKFKVGYMIDAHHRTEGHYLAGASDLEMNATIYVDLPKERMAGVFASINEKQEKPSPTHTLAMREMAGTLKQAEKAAVEIAKIMNNEPASVLHQRIALFDGRAPKGHLKPYVKLKPFSVLLKDEILPEIPGDHFAVKQAIIEDYFKAWKAVFPDAWADEKSHVLVKAMGFTIISKLFGRIFETATAKFKTKAPKQKHFEAVIATLEGMEVYFDEETTFPLDWSSDKFGGFSSGKGINALYKDIDDHLKQSRLELLGMHD